MKYNWTTKRLSEIAYINPRESIRKGIVSKKVPMDKLQPFCRDIPEFVFEEYRGGTKFRNGDTIMARITPCLENGKIAKVSILDDDEIGFGSTEYIVFRAINGICDADFLYYLICSPLVRNPAIKSTLFPELEHQLFMYHTGENMEYYILKCYQEAKNECPEVEQGLDRFDPKIKKIVIVCFIVMFVSCAEMIFTMLLFSKQLWYCIGIDFINWLYLATFLLVSIASAGIWIYSYTFFDTLKRKYELMIKDLKELLLLKY